MSRAQQVLLLLVAGIAVVALGAAAAFLMTGSNEAQSQTPVAAASTNDTPETVVVTETAVRAETEKKTETQVVTETVQAETEQPETVTVTETETQASTVEDTDVEILIDDISVEVYDTYSSCEAAVKALVAAAEDYDGSAQSYADLARAAAAAEAACSEAATDISDIADDAASTGSEELEQALQKYVRLAEAQTGAAGSLEQALQSSSKRGATILAASYSSLVSSFQGQAKAATKSLELARTQAGLPATPPAPTK